MNGARLAPETQYAKSGDVNIAYQVVGDGPNDLVLVPGAVSHVEFTWENPLIAHFYKRLASFSRLILFDKRGTGLSDRVRDPEAHTLEQRMDDVRAVMDAAGSERATLLGISEGGPMAMLFAATYPRRVSALVLYGTFATRVIDADHPWGWPVEGFEERLPEYEKNWGRSAQLTVTAPSLANDPWANEWWAKFERLGASPGAAVALRRMNRGIDVRAVLSTIQVPTLVAHRIDDLVSNVAEGRYLAGHIRGAKLVELPGGDHLYSAGDSDAIVDEIEEFLTGVRPGPEPDRVLATVLFTDIVGSTERADALGDRRWAQVLEEDHALVRRELDRHQGHEVDTAGDGFLATFDGPARAIRCAASAAASVRHLGIEIRAGIHTGECEVVGSNVRGMAVHIGARVASLAGPSEVLVSSTVKDLVTGSGIEFEDRGSHSLKGVASEWRIFAAKI